MGVYFYCTISRQLLETAATSFLYLASSADTVRHISVILCTRPGGSVGYVGVSHGEELFFAEVHLHGGSAPVRRYLPELIDLIWKWQIDPGKVFDLELPLDQAVEGYRAMDERRAVKVLLRP